MDIKALSCIIISVVCFCLNISCRKSCVPEYYTFEIDSSYFYPNRDSIKIGDTLFFKSITSTQLINVPDGKRIDYSNVKNFGSIIGFGELIGPNQSNDAVGDFIIIPLKGKIYSDNSAPSPGRIKQVVFAEENGQYILSFALIAQKKGIYALFTANMPDVVENCDRSTILMNITNTNSHLQYIKNIYYGGGAINPLDSAHLYCFKVY